MKLWRQAEADPWMVVAGIGIYVLLCAVVVLVLHWLRQHCAVVKPVEPRRE